MSNTAIMLERTTGGSVSFLQNLVFNTLSYLSGSINYDPSSGVITFLEPGRYSVNWWVAVQSSAATDGATFSFETTENITVFGNSPIKTDEVVGRAVFDVTAPLVTASLVCRCDPEVYLSSDVMIKANLTVVMLEQFGLTETAAIIPYASGIPVEISSQLSGLAGTPAIIGFGSAFEYPTVLGASLDIFGLNNLAFSMPRNGYLTEISLYFSATLVVSIALGTVNLRAEIYRSPTPNNIFTPTGVFVTIPITSTIAIGDTFNANNSGFSVPVNAQDRLMMVVSVTTDGIGLATSLTGQFSGGLTIASDV